MTVRASLVAVALLMCASASSAQWISDGAPICTALNYSFGPRIISDGSGGALIAYEDTRGGTGDIYVQRVTPTGIAQWTHDGVAMCVAPNHQQDAAMTTDGTGGAIVAWVDYRDVATNDADIYCRRISGNGIPLWSANGVAVCTHADAQTFVEVVTDGAGGAILVWSDRRNGQGYDVYAQRVDGSGVVQWALDGIEIATQPEDQFIEHAAPDGAGGAIVAWHDRRSSAYADIYAQRVSHFGLAQWKVDGVAVCNADSTQRNPKVVGDGSGGAIVTWWDFRSGAFDIYSQRVSGAGVPLWTPNGVPVCTAADEQSSAQAIADGSGGVVIAWDDRRNGTDGDVYAQRLNAAGTPQWTSNGVKMCDAAGDQYGASLASDGLGGAVVAWSDGRSGVPNEYDIYARHISSAGTLGWTPNGVLLCGAALDQSEASLISDGSGGAIVVWLDDRVGEYDVYAQRVLSSGSLSLVTAVSSRAPSMRVGDAYPNPFAGTTALDVALSSPASVRVDVFDVAGRRVRSDALPIAAGARRLEFDGRDDAGRLLPSGVYFYRVKAAGQTITRKMVIAR